MSVGASNLKEGLKAALSLATKSEATASIVILSDVSDATGVLTLYSLVQGAEGNNLKVVITNPGPDDAALATSMGGAGNNTLTIALGRTGASTDSTKNTVLAIATAIDAISTNKKIDAVASGNTARKITLTAASADFTGGVSAGSNGIGVAHAGFDEALVVLTLGAFDAGATVAVTIEGSSDNVSFAVITGAAFGTLGDTHASSVKTGILNLTKVPKYLRAASVLAVGDVQHSVVFVFAGGQYQIPSENTHLFTV